MGDHRVPFKVKPGMREKVERLAVAGFTHAQIAEYFDIDDKTLRKYFRDELTKATMDKTEKLASSLYKDAEAGDKQSREFWLRTRGGWYNARPKEDGQEKTHSLLEQIVDGLCGKK